MTRSRAFQGVFDDLLSQMAEGGLSLDDFAQRMAEFGDAEAAARDVAEARKQGDAPADASGPQASSGLAALLRAAALCGPFLPDALAPLDGSAGPADRAALAERCEAVTELGAVRLTLAPADRIERLARMRDAGELGAAVASMRRRKEDPLGRELTDFLARHPPVADASAPPDAGRLSDARLARRLEVAEWFEAAPDGWPPGMGEEAEALRLETARRAERASLEALAQGFRGRRGDQLKLAAFLRRDFGPGARRPPVLAISGGGGTGKSALLAKFALNLADRPRDGWRTIRMDLADPVLRGAEPSALSFEFTRRLGRAAPELEAALSRLRRDARREIGAFAYADPAQRALGRSAAWRACARLMDGMRSLLHATGGSQRPVALLLDSMDAALRGETPDEQDLSAAAQLRRWLDELVASGGLDALRVVIAGGGLERADAPPLEAVEVHELNPLGAEDAAEVVREAAAALPETKVRELVAQLPGRADALRLAAQLAAGAEAALAELKGQAPASGPTAEGQATAYERQLARIPDPELRALAAWTPALRRLAPEVLRAALAPAAELAPLGARQARSLLDRLARERWLISGPAPGGGIEVRRELRRLVLGGLSRDPARAGRVAALHEAAMTAFEAVPDGMDPDDAEAEALYHRLMHLPLDGRARRALRSHANALAPDARDLPAPARAAVLLAAGRPMSDALARELEGADRARFLDARGWELVGEDRPADALSLLSPEERTAPGLPRGWISQARLDLGDWTAGADARQVRDADFAALESAAPEDAFREGAPLVRRLILDEAADAEETARRAAATLLRRLLDVPPARAASPAMRAQETGALRLALIARRGRPLAEDERDLLTAALARSVFPAAGAEGAMPAALTEAWQTAALLRRAGLGGLLDARGTGGGAPLPLAPGLFRPDPAWLEGPGSVGAGPARAGQGPLRAAAARGSASVLGPLAVAWATGPDGAPLAAAPAGLDDAALAGLAGVSAPELHAPARRALAAAAPDRAALRALAAVMHPLWPAAPADFDPDGFAETAARTPLRALSALTEYADRSGLFDRLLAEAETQARRRDAQGPANALARTRAALARWTAAFAAPTGPASAGADRTFPAPGAIEGG